MVRFLKRGYSLDRFLLRRFRMSSEPRSRPSPESCAPDASPPPEEDNRVLSRTHGSRRSSCRYPDLPPLAGGGTPGGSGAPGGGAPSGREKGAACSRLGRDAGGNGPPSDVDLLKEKFAKLLLGEDMSGTGKGVSSALALSNAITNLAASVFGEQRRLEPMAAERKARWRKEIDWLLSVTDHIVEFVPSQQVSKDGTNMEIMVTQQRRDLHMNIPALRKLDAMLLEYLDNFKDNQEFWYVSKDADESEKGSAQRQDDKWWLPTVKVPPDGLSEVSKKWLQYQKELVSQVLKAAMAINANVLMEMEIPEAYTESLPKNGRSSLGDSMYKSITDDSFDPGELLRSADLSTEHKIVDLKDRIEASVVIWQRKMCNKDAKSSWGPSGVSFEKREQFEERANTLLLLLKHRFPGIAQSSLDISKIQYNKDVGFAILESYSRILESLAFTVVSRIEDVLYADSVAQDLTIGESKRGSSLPSGGDKAASETKAELEKANSAKLSDFMGWQSDQVTEAKKKDLDSNVAASKRFSYIEKLETLGGLRSPRSRR